MIKQTKTKNERFGTFFFESLKVEGQGFILWTFSCKDMVRIFILYKVLIFIGKYCVLFLFLTCL